MSDKDFPAPALIINVEDLRNNKKLLDLVREHADANDAQLVLLIPDPLLNDYEDGEFGPDLEFEITIRNSQPLPRQAFTFMAVEIINDSPSLTIVAAYTSYQAECGPLSEQGVPFVVYAPSESRPMQIWS